MDRERGWTYRTERGEKVRDRENNGTESESFERETVSMKKWGWKNEERRIVEQF